MFERSEATGLQNTEGTMKLLNCNLHSGVIEQCLRSIMHLAFSNGDILCRVESTFES